MSEHLIYSVELDLVERELEAEFEDWYAKHLKKLLAVPGINAVQQFKSLTPSLSPYLALYQIDSTDVLDSAAYRAVGGPPSAKQWNLVHWHRNVFASDRSWPDVASTLNLLMLDGDANARLPQGDLAGTTMKPIALDRTVEQRVLAAVTDRTLDADRYRPWTARLFRPITDRLGNRV